MLFVSKRLLQVKKALEDEDALDIAKWQRLTEHLASSQRYWRVLVAAGALVFSVWLSLGHWPTTAHHFDRLFRAALAAFVVVGICWSMTGSAAAKWARIYSNGIPTVARIGWSFAKGSVKCSYEVEGKTYRRRLYYGRRREDLPEYKNASVADVEVLYPPGVIPDGDLFVAGNGIEIIYDSQAPGEALIYSARKAGLFDLRKRA